MAAPALRHEASTDPEFLLACLLLRALARSWLWACWDIVEKDEAVDPLWHWAEARGLVDHFGPDHIQAVLAEGFRFDRW